MSSINLQDISSMVSIISVCSQRGAFRAEELENVGILYKKMKQFLDEAQEKIKAEEPKKEEKKEEETEIKDTTGGEKEETVAGHSVKFI